MDLGNKRISSRFSWRQEQKLNEVGYKEHKQEEIGRSKKW